MSGGHVIGRSAGCAFAFFAVLGIAHAAPPDVEAPSTGDPNELGEPPSAAPEPAPTPSAAPAPSASAPDGSSAAPSAAAPSVSRPVRNMDSNSERWPTSEAPEPPPPPPPWEVRPFSVEGHLGAGTPVGAIGIMLDYLVSPAFSVAAGVGFGSGPKDSPGPHGAVMARVRPARGEKNAFILGAGVSVGPYQRFGSALGDYGNSVSTSFGSFFQGEVGWERRTPKGFLVRLTVGFAAMLNPGSLQCKDAYSSDVLGFGGSSQSTSCSVWKTGEDHQEILPVIDFAIGHSF